MRVLFLCPHGGAKSVIAAAQFNRLARERGLSFEATSAATEDPYDAVPAPVAAFLEREGLDGATLKPHRVLPDEIDGAARIVTIGCDVPHQSERWDDVPQASEDLEGAVAAIRRHVEALAEELDGHR